MEVPCSEVHGSLLGGQDKASENVGQGLSLLPEVEQILLSDKHSLNSNFVSICLDYMGCIHSGPIYPRT